MRTRAPAAPRLLQPGVPRDLETITLKCLQKTAAYPDHRRLAAGARDGTIRVWDLPTGKVLFTRVPHGGEVGAVAISPDKRRLAAGMENGTVVLCDEYGKELFTLRPTSATGSR